MLLAWTMSVALAWTEATETTLIEAALADAWVIPEGAPPADPAAAARVRLAIDVWARTAAPPAQRDAWVKRLPTPESYDAWALKDALGLAVSATVVGIDAVDPTPWARTAILAPRRDGRHALEPAHGADRQPMRLADGREIPSDPSVFLAGDPAMPDVSPFELLGPKQQPLGHDARLEVALNGPVEVYRRELDLSQSFVDLAVLAATDDVPDPATARTWLSQAQYYLLSSSDPMLCAECCMHAFTGDAFGEGIRRSIFTAGGYLGEVPPYSTIGFDLMLSRRSLASGIIDASLASPDSPDGQRLRAAIRDGDIVSSKDLFDGLKRANDPPERSAYAEIAAKWMIGVVDFNAVKLWRYLHRLADERPGVPPVAATRDEAPDIYAYQLDEYVGSLHRAGVSMRAAEAHTAKLVADAAASSEQRLAIRALVLERLVGRQLAFLSARDALRAGFVASPPPPRITRVSAPEILVAELVAVAAVATLGVGVGVFLRQRRAIGHVAEG
jgi:hypothetical protein